MYKCYYTCINIKYICKIYLMLSLYTMRSEIFFCSLLISPICSYFYDCLFHFINVSQFILPLFFFFAHLNSWFASSPWHIQISFGLCYDHLFRYALLPADLDQQYSNVKWMQLLSANTSLHFEAVVLNLGSSEVLTLNTVYVCYYAQVCISGKRDQSFHENLKDICGIQVSGLNVQIHTVWCTLCKSPAILSYPSLLIILAVN